MHHPAQFECAWSPLWARRHFGLDKLASSPMMRAVQTAEALKKYHPDCGEVDSVDGLREMCFGELEGRRIQVCALPAPEASGSGMLCSKYLLPGAAGGEGGGAARRHTEFLGASLHRALSAEPLLKPPPPPFAAAGGRGCGAGVARGWGGVAGAGGGARAGRAGWAGRADAR